MEFFEDEEADWGNPIHHMMAGAIAGTAEHCSLFPLDVVKGATRLFCCMVWGTG